MGSRRIQIAVIGSSNPTSRGAQMAFDVGSLLATRHAVVVCGGLGGVMDAACRGAHHAGGLSIAVVPGDRSEASPWASAVVAPGAGYGRNWVIINSVDGVVAVEGQLGTLSELCFAAQRGLPIAGLSTWDLPELPVRHSASPHDAVAWIMGVINA